VLGAAYYDHSLLSHASLAVGTYTLTVTAQYPGQTLAAGSYTPPPQSITIKTTPTLDVTIVGQVKLQAHTGFINLVTRCICVVSTVEWWFCFRVWFGADSNHAHACLPVPVQVKYGGQVITAQQAIAGGSKIDKKMDVTLFGTEARRRFFYLVHDAITLEATH